MAKLKLTLLVAVAHILLVETQASPEGLSTAIRHQWQQQIAKLSDLPDAESQAESQSNSKLALYYHTILTSVLQTRLDRSELPAAHFRLQPLGAFLVATRLLPNTTTTRQAVGALSALYAKHKRHFESFQDDCTNVTAVQRRAFYTQKVAIPERLAPAFSDLLGKGCAPNQTDGGGDGISYCQYGYVMDRCLRAYASGLCRACLRAPGGIPPNSMMPDSYRELRQAEFLVTVWPRWHALVEHVKGGDLEMAFTYEGGELLAELEFVPLSAASGDTRAGEDDGEGNDEEWSDPWTVLMWSGIGVFAVVCLIIVGVVYYVCYYRHRLLKEAMARSGNKSRKRSRNAKKQRKSAKKRRSTTRRPSSTISGSSSNATKSGSRSKSASR